MSVQGIEVLFQFLFIKIPQKINIIVSVCRIFSLQVPLAARTFVSFVYKPPVGVKVSLELKTIDVPLCTFDGTDEIPCEWPKN